jgi:hypothetical protein
MYLTSPMLGGHESLTVTDSEKYHYNVLKQISWIQYTEMIKVDYVYQ